MNMRSLLTPILVVLALGVSTATAGRGTLSVRCEGQVSANGSTLPKGQLSEAETSSATKLHSVSVGVLEDGESFQCAFIVPQDYDDQANDPAVIRFYGWVPPSQPCGLLACTNPNDLTFSIYWRDYDDSDPTSIGESQSEETNTQQIRGGGSCGAAFCWEDDDMYAFTSDIVGNSSVWTPGNLVVIRPERQDDADDYAGDFWVWLQSIEIEYPN